MPLTEEERIRRIRLDKLREAGVDPYPASSHRTHTGEQFFSAYEQIEKSGEQVVVTGRIRTIRKHGGLTFVHLEDGSGRLQLVLKRDHLGENVYTFFHDTMDIGDFVEVAGKPFTTQKGERSLAVDIYQVLSKALLPMPEKWHGLSDVETRYRRRYLDLLANESVRHIFHVRAVILTTIRTYLNEHGFLEVETPVLQTVPGGANAKPFETHHDALDIDMYLRIAPELYLKRLLVGGYERVYEVARCFRNEGIDHMHNPEFTQVEGYAAYLNYEKLMDFLEGMMQEIIRAAGLNPATVPYKGYTLNFSSPWPRLTFRDAILQYTHIDIRAYPDRESIAKVAMKLGVPVETSASYGTILDQIYKHTVRPVIIQPTYIYDYPAAISPLAKRKVSDPGVIEMFQMVYGGGEENIKAFSELNDPLDQEARFREQDAAREQGDEEAQFGDYEYVEAMKHGMPPNAGFGIGIDRLTALLTDSPNLKEVILFPTMRPL
ncbi:MAG: Lysine-tRNA ligase [Candidatus Uhrbacteria bacterium GW2011_GWF2_41_16]|uniref:Lysine--tRNA ligase n=2 Tax=Candidatus Uhriibacteriota TaxID=1752732 RepID=A0A0G0VBU8_9BACT|nr:MAG: Lysine-tRNA ligase [Candidatus Uhrbacteria bacterium GW2011_GWA2_41_10]KKR86052.1 MAG: Lysine-tRNA ligase [Candidatus Uhrbacteria bacterium GW2011_GWC2_41_11]KKR97106.1 MAG: Lysine-tRNA ligase [Candidatus Uhrbacteria bacterium GW2011_GWF2_41_16]HBP00311.1 lysine--tRNA ligase [Candidatus Uhrbacteria bacterium]